MTGVNLKFDHPPQIQFVVHAIAEPGDLELSLEQVQTLVIPALVAQGLEVSVTDLSQTGVAAQPDLRQLPLTLQARTGNPDRDALVANCQAQTPIHKVVEDFGVPIGIGQYWLPVAWTSKGPLYGELIGQDRAGNFCQPVHLADPLRQPLYHLAQALLSQVAPELPACYLLQVGWHQNSLCFERLWPFPIRPAVASIGVQTPDLLLAHVACVLELPLKDLRISGQVPYHSL